MNELDKTEVVLGLFQQVVSGGKPVNSKGS
jgi:hypothetical protein